MSQEQLDQAAGAKLKELRQKAEMSQEGLSLASGVDQSTLSKVERLGPGAMGWARFCRIAAVLGHEVEIIYRPVSAVRPPEDSDAAISR